MMKTFIVDRYGSKDGVRAGDMPEPELREDDVLVQVHACNGYLVHPFEKEASWAFTACLFLMVK